MHRKGWTAHDSWLIRFGYAVGLGVGTFTPSVAWGLGIALAVLITAAVLLVWETRREARR